MQINFSLIDQEPSKELRTSCYITISACLTDFLQILGYQYVTVSITPTPPRIIRLYYKKGQHSQMVPRLRSRLSSKFTITSLNSPGFFRRSTHPARNLQTPERYPLSYSIPIPLQQIIFHRWKATWSAYGDGKLGIDYRSLCSEYSTHVVETEGKKSLSTKREGLYEASGSDCGVFGTVCREIGKS